MNTKKPVFGDPDFHFSPAYKHIDPSDFTPSNCTENTSASKCLATYNFALKQVQIAVKTAVQGLETVLLKGEKFDLLMGAKNTENAKSPSAYISPGCKRVLPEKDPKIAETQSFVSWGEMDKDDPLVVQAGLNWHETLHPRGNDGKFGAGNSKGKTPETRSAVGGGEMNKGKAGNGSKSKGKIAETHTVLDGGEMKEIEKPGNSPSSNSQNTPDPSKPPGTAPKKRGFFDNPKTAVAAVQEQLKKLAGLDKTDKKDDLDLVGSQKDRSRSQKDHLRSRGIEVDPKRIELGLKEVLSDPKLQITVASGAAAAGMPIALFLAHRFHYRAGFKKSAEIAGALAKDVAVPDKIVGLNGEPAKQISLLVGGFGGKQGRLGEHFQKRIAKGANQGKADGIHGVFADHQLDSVSNRRFDISPNSKMLGKNREGTPLENATQGMVSDSQRLILQTALKGRNPVAVDIAAKAMAYSQKHPGVPVNLIGHSGGGMATDEAYAILKEAGVKVKVLNLGAPHFGLTPAAPKSQVATIYSSKDPVVVNPKKGKTRFPIKNGVKVDTVSDHGAYFDDPQVHEKMSQFFA